MSLHSLSELFAQTKNACAAIRISDCNFISDAFKDAYARYVEEEHPNGYAEILWDEIGGVEIVARDSNKRILLSPVSFLFAKALVPYCAELKAYKQAVMAILKQYGEGKKYLKEHGESSVLPMIDKTDLYSDDDKAKLRQFLTDGESWGKGKSVDREDFLISPLMKAGGLQAETQGNIADITCQLVDNQSLYDKLLGSLEEAFKAWYLNVKCKGPNKTETNSTIRHYATGLKAVSMDQGEKDTQKWCGIYEYLLGYKPKPVFLIGSLKEFDDVYGLFSDIFIDNPRPQLDVARCEACHRYVKGPRNSGYLNDHGNLAAAFSAYREFLLWREDNSSIKDIIISGTQFWTYSPGRNGDKWNEVRKDGEMTLRLQGCPDFNSFADEEAIRAWFQDKEGDEASHKNNVCAAIEFRDKIKIGDYVFAKKGLKTYLGVGKVVGDYVYDETREEYRHVRKVEWIKVKTIDLEDARPATKMLTNVTPWPDFVEKIWKAYFEPIEDPIPPNVDRLTIALKLFKEMRTKPIADGGWFEDGVKVNALQREYFATLTPEVLRTWGIPEITNFFISRPNGGRYGWMWSGTNGAGWNQIKNGLDEGSAPQIAEFLTRVAKSSQFAADFCKKGYEKPDGFGSGVISELLMKFYPSEYIKHGFVSHAVLKDLGLISFLHRADYTEGQYKQVLGVSSMLLDRMCEMKLPRAINQDGTEDTTKPDYLTVNEFIWFVNEKKDLLKEEVLKMSEKKIEKKPRMGDRKLGDAAKDPLMQRLMAALRTKPFAILAGHSGTGKSRMVRRLAYMTCNDEGLLAEAEKSNAPGNYCMVQVKPNWHDSTDLIGYYSELNGGAYHTTPFVEFVAKAYAYPETPFFVCLDEMNLAPVEHYFAEYLSAIESRDAKTGLTDALIPNTYEPNEVMPHELISESVKEFKAHGLTIPRNLFVVGTVNMDETTHQFSRKVLDRAMTILMDEVDFASMSSGVEPSDEQLLDPDGIKFFLDAAENVKFDDAALLTKLNAELANTPFVVAYRFAKEFALYKEAIKKLDASATEMTALDHMVLMKLLPRIHGEKEMVKHIFEGKDAKGGIKSVVGEGLSKAQMDSILARSDEYLTFWP